MPGPGGRITGAYKAQAEPGGQLLAAELDRMAAEGGVKSLHAKLVYLTNSVAGQEAMVAAGINLASRSTRSTVLGWLADDELASGTGISRANARRVDEAYAARRRETMAGRLKKRLARGGGAYVEVTPPDQSKVERRHRRTVEDLGRGVTSIRIREAEWDDIVDAWAAGDDAGLQRTWESVCDDQLYPPEAFYACGDIQVAA